MVRKIGVREQNEQKGGRHKGEEGREKERNLRITDWLNGSYVMDCIS